MQLLLILVGFIESALNSVSHWMNFPKLVVDQKLKMSDFQVSSSFFVFGADSCNFFIKTLGSVKLGAIVTVTDIAAVLLIRAFRNTF